MGAGTGSQASGAAEGDQLELIERIGKGSSGEVFRALDRRRGRTLALKSVARDGVGLRRARSLCKTLEAISHPNLVKTEGVVEVDGKAYIAMEYVDGIPFTRFAQRAKGTQLEVWLRDALGQLVSGLRALHRSHHVHRDIKPDNVLVTDEGRVVVLDMGLMGEIGEREDVAVGTAPYLPPEQALGKQVSPAADWFAVGVMVYEALSGQLPFEGTDEQLLAAKEDEAFRPLSELDPDLSYDVVALVSDLLRTDPDKRPAGRQILQRLGLEAEDRPSVLASVSMLSGGMPFVGHAALLDRLTGVGQSRQRLHYLVGPAGRGKSSVLREVVRRRRALDHRAWVFELHCTRTYAVSLSPLHQLADALGRALLGPEVDDSTGSWASSAAAVALFPSLGGAFATTAAHTPLQNPLEERRRGLTGLGRLLHAVSEHRDCAIVIDDWHHADPDTRWAVQHLLQQSRDAKNCHWVLATDHEPTEQDVPGAVEHLDPLAEPDAQRLSRELLVRATGHARDPVEQLARVSGGEPRHAHELIRHKLFFGRSPQQSGDAMYEQRVQALTDEARKVLQVLAVAEDPLPCEAAMLAASLSPQMFVRQLSVLRVSGHAITPRVREVEHAGIADSELARVVRATISAERLQQIHASLARAFVGRTETERARLCFHAERGGMQTLVKRHLPQLAQDALAASAFQLAAGRFQQLWQLHADATPLERRDLDRRLGEVLTLATRRVEAAEAYLRAADSATAADSLQLRRLASELLLTAGEVERGLETVDETLQAVGESLTRTAGEALRMFLWTRTVLGVRGYRHKRRPAESISERDLRRVDVLLAMGKQLSIVDFMSGAAYQSRALRIALALGEPERVATGLALEVMLLSPTDKPDLRRAMKVLQRARDIGNGEDLYFRALCNLVEGVAFNSQLRPAPALPLLAKSERALREECVEVPWELSGAQQQLLLAHFMLGRYRNMFALGEQFLAAAAETGNVYVEANIALGTHYHSMLAQQRPDDALRWLEEITARWADGSFQVHHFLAMCARCEVALFRGDPQAEPDLEAQWPALQRSGLMRIPVIRNYASMLRAQAALGAAEHSEQRRAELLKRVRKLAAGERRMPQFVSRGHARHMLGAADALEGKTDSAIAHLREALALYEQVEYRGYAHGAQYGLGTLLGGEEGQQLCDAVQQELAAEGFADPLGRIRAEGRGFRV